MSRLHTRLILSGIAVTIGLGVGVPASAQIEEIVVTATKREESIQDVPIAVTAISDVQLERAGIADVRDLVRLTPSFNMNSSQTETGGTTLRIRGVGTTGNNIGLESAVGVFVDGVYLSRPGVALSEFLDLEQIEILRGPQGTLFGRNTTSGALNIKTKKPNVEENEFWANFTVGNFDLFNVQAGANVALNDTMAVRIAGAWRDQDGFEKSWTGAESRNKDRYALRAQFLWLPNEDISLRVIADYSEADERCCDAVIQTESPIVAAGAFAAAGLPANGGVFNHGTEALEGRRENAEQFENGFEQWGISAELNWDFGWADLVYIPSYREFDSTSVQQSDFVGIDVFSVPSTSRVGNPFGLGGATIETMTHELRLQGATDRFEWMVGLYYAEEEILPNGRGALELGADYDRYISAVAFFGGLYPAVGAAVGGDATVGRGIVGLLPGGAVTGAQIAASANPARTLAGGADALGAFAVNNMFQDGTSWSIFTHNTLHVTEQLDLVVGLRYVNEKKDGKFDQVAANSPHCRNTKINAGAIAAANAGGAFETVANNLAAFAIGFMCFPFAAEVDGLPGSPVEFDQTFKDTELIYTGKLVYAFDDNITAYVSFTHGFKAGGFNLDPTAAVNGADPRFKSELTDAYEIGVKSDLFGGLLRANLSLFHMEMEDFQVLEFTGIQFVTFNVPEAKSTGAELELTMSPMDGLIINTGLTYADARYSESCDDFSPTAPGPVASLCGFQLTNSARFSAVVGTVYEGQIPGTELGYFVAANYRWESGRRTSTQPIAGLEGARNNPTDVQPSNGKADLRIGVTGVDNKWAVELWGTNIFDKQTKFVTFNVPLRGTGALNTQSRGAFLEAPRTYGVTVRIRY